MSKKKKELFEYENDQCHELFDFINKDLDLLFIIIFLEAFYRGDDVIGFGDFLKGNYWNIDNVWEEITDTNDYYSIPDMVMEQVIFIFEDARMGKVIGVGIDNLDYAFSDLLIEIAKIGAENAKREAPDHVGTIEQICFLRRLKEDKFQTDLEAHPAKSDAIWKNRFVDKGIFFSKEDGYFRKLQILAIEIPNRIFFNVTYNKNKVKEIESAIEKFLIDFSQDKFLSGESVPFYQEKRLYFSQQVENFYHYINKLTFIGDVANIPFDILAETGFEAVKILKYLELKNIIEMNWSDEGSWRVRFKKFPVTPKNLIGFDVADKLSGKEKLKLALSFNEARAILEIGDKDVKLQKGSDQFHLLRIIFEDTNELAKEWFYSEIAEKYDMGASFDDKKFYNASYQVNQKIARDTALKDFFITTRQSVRINPKYLS